MKNHITHENSIGSKQVDDIQEIFENREKLIYKFRDVLRSYVKNFLCCKKVRRVIFYNDRRKLRKKAEKKVI